MCNTWRNVFLQSMKTNTLSVKKLTKNLILRALRQLYAVSEIIILIRWVTPPQKLKIFNLSFSSVLKFLSCSYSSTLQNLHCFRRFSSLAIYIWVYVLYSIHLLLILQVGFSAKWMWSDPSPLCYTQPNLFTNSSCAFYLKLVQNLHCVLVSWRNCERNFKIYLI